MSTPTPIRNSVAVADPNSPNNAIAPNSDGSLNVKVTGGSFTGSTNIAQVGGNSVVTAGVNGLLAIGGSSAAAATDDASNPLKIGGIYNTALPTYTNGQRGNFQMTANGSLRSYISGVANSGSDGFSNNSLGYIANDVNSNPLLLACAGSNFNGTSWNRIHDIVGALASGATGTGTSAVERAGTNFSEITTATSTTVKGSAGILHRVSVNTGVASATIKIYNATSATGTPITITCPSTAGNPFYLDYDIYMSTGIFIVTSGATDVTVTYR